MSLKINSKRVCKNNSGIPFSLNMRKREFISDYGDFLEPLQFHRYKPVPSQESKFEFMSKIFTFKNKPKKFRQIKNPQIRRIQQIGRLSPSDQQENLYMVAGDGNRCEPKLKEDFNMVDSNIIKDEYNFIYLEEPEILNTENMNDKCVKESKISSEKEKILEDIRKNKTYFEVVKVVDKGTETVCMEELKLTENKETDPMIPGDSSIFNWEKEKQEIMSLVQNRDTMIEQFLGEGKLLLDQIYEIKKHLSGYKNITEFITANINNMPTLELDPKDYLQMSRAQLKELGILYLEVLKQTELSEQSLKDKIHTIKEENLEYCKKVKSLECKIQVQSTKEDQESQDVKVLEVKVKHLEGSLQAGKKLLKDTERTYKERIQKVEKEVTSQLLTNTKLAKELDDKVQLVSQLNNNIEKLRKTLEEYKQQAKEVHFSYKSKIAKLESEYTNKMSVLCDNQTKTNKQLSQALDQSSNYVTQIQEIKNENAAIQAANSSINDKMGVMERELAKAQERCAATERKLSRETQEVMALKSLVDRLETLKEEELLSVDGDTWCQIMYQQDQTILDDLRASLQDKEKNLEVLRAQGDCPLKDFEKVQSELQQRRQQFNELKDVFLDFEKKRDSVVREQREFYNKMMLLSRTTIPKEKFFKNLIEECQSKTEKIQELQDKLNSTERMVEEAKKVSQAQMKAMQMDMKYTAEKLYEFENEMKIKDMELKNVIRVFEQEKKNTMAAEEAMNSYKMLLDESKKENAEIRNKLNYLEDFEKNRHNVLKVTEELVLETQKRQDTENKLNKIEKDLLDMKKGFHSKENLTSHSDNNSTKTGKEVDQLKLKIQDLTANKKYMERILKESQKSKEILQKDHEHLCKKMRHAVRVMIESKETQEALELKLDKRKHMINQLQKSQADTENRLDSLKEVLQEMKQTIDLLHKDRDELRNQLLNHTHCNAERTLHHELKLLQRDKAVIEEQNLREKEMLLHRLKDNESTMKEMHNHLRAFQEQLDGLNAQLKETKAQQATERHQQTQQLLTLQSDKRKLEMFIKELEGRLAYERRLKLEPLSTTPVSTPVFTTSDSYDTSNRDYTKGYYRK